MNKELSSTSSSNVHAIPPTWFKYVFGTVILMALAYISTHLIQDLAEVPPLSALSFVMLGLALITALGFEFVEAP